MCRQEHKTLFNNSSVVVFLDQNPELWIKDLTTWNYITLRTKYRAKASKHWVNDFLDMTRKAQARKKKTSGLCIKIHYPFQLGPGTMAPAKTGPCAIHEAMTSEYTTNTHKHPHGGGSKKPAPRALNPKICHEGGGNSRCPALAQGWDKAVWAKGIRNVTYCIPVWQSKKCNEDEDLPNKIYTLVTYVPVTTFKKTTNS